MTAKGRRKDCKLYICNVDMHVTIVSKWVLNWYERYMKFETATCIKINLDMQVGVKCKRYPM